MGLQWSLTPRSWIGLSLDSLLLFTTCTRSLVCCVLLRLLRDAALSHYMLWLNLLSPLVRASVYPHVDEIMTDVRERAAVIAKGTKPLSAILPKRHRSHSVADVADFTTPLAVNPDFSQLTENKSISTERVGTVSFFELERMESSIKSLLEANSYSLWLLSALLPQLKRNGFCS